LRDILSMAPTTEGERWSKVLNAAQFLMAAFTTPYSVTEDYLDKLFLEAASLFLDVKAGKTKTNLANRPEMQAMSQS